MGVDFGDIGLCGGFLEIIKHKSNKSKKLRRHHEKPKLVCFKNTIKHGELCL